MTNPTNPTTGPGGDPTRHPDLLRWLGERQADHDAGAPGLEAAAPVAYTDAFLNRLETLIKRAYDEGDGEFTKLTAHRQDPLVQAALWYLGETIRRRKGWVWKYLPDPNFGLQPFYAAEPSSALDHPCVGPADAPAESEHHWYPLNMLRRTLICVDDVDNEIDESLVGMVEGWYEEDEEDDEE
ncbi:hypothetical protein ACIRPT_26045 [Streptomyces sp. NPDC101227]|uniref:hypothetical protein n=1 Tax=Streptomyces sp. NPDC101227 TaxID=3366136 RepID=UPI0037F45F6A